MTNQAQSIENSGCETVTLHLNSYSKIEQAELIARFYINSNCDRHEAAVIMCCIADLLYDAMNN